MGKVIFEITDVHETPRSKPTLSIEISYQPARQNGKAKELSDFILLAIDEFNDLNGGRKIESIERIIHG